MCRRDHGLTWGEFESLTLPELEALEERRTIALRHERFNAALVASALINSHRVSEDSPAVSPFDFLPGFDRDPEEEEREKTRKSVKHAVAAAFTEMRGATPEQVQAAKAQMVLGMTKSGIEDPEGLIREVFPEI